MISCNVISPQLFWFKKHPHEHPVMFVSVDLREHRHVVRALRHHRDLAAPRPSWDYFVPVTEVFFLLGTFGLFFTLFLLFVRFFPVIAMSEVKAVMPQANPHWEGYAKHEHGHAHGDAHGATHGAGGH
jgi:hypothetical protein